MINIKIGNNAYDVEVVTTDKDKHRGLSYRNNLPKKNGMLFLFSFSGTQTFYTKDMKFTIDILFIQDNKIFKIIDSAKPNVDDIYSSEGPCNMVLEINGGECKKNNIEVGGLVSIEIEKSYVTQLGSWLSKQASLEKQGGQCSVGQHEHQGIMGCHRVRQHHRFEHRQSGFEDEFTYPLPESEEEDVITNIGTTSIARAHDVSPDSLLDALKRIYGIRALSNQVVDRTVYTPEGKLLRFKQVVLTPSQIETA
ncbi:MAG: DUF192 domain-containing protein, partial [Nanoarchaeota archaeon]